MTNKLRTALQEVFKESRSRSSALHCAGFCFGLIAMMAPAVNAESIIVPNTNTPTLAKTDPLKGNNVLVGIELVDRIGILTTENNAGFSVQDAVADADDKKVVGIYVSDSTVESDVESVINLTSQNNAAEKVGFNTNSSSHLHLKRNLTINVDGATAAYGFTGKMPDRELEADPVLQVDGKLSVKAKGSEKVNGAYLDGDRRQDTEETYEWFDIVFHDVEIQTEGKTQAIGLLNSNGAKTRIKGDLRIDNTNTGSATEESAALSNSGVLVVDGNVDLSSTKIDGEEPIVLIIRGNTVFRGDRHNFHGTVTQPGYGFLVFGRKGARTQTFVEGDLHSDGSNGSLVTLNNDLYVAGNVVYGANTQRKPNTTLVNSIMRIGGDEGKFQGVNVLGDSAILIDDKDTTLVVYDDYIYEVDELSKLTLGGTGRVNDQIGGDITRIYGQITTGNWSDENLRQLAVASEVKAVLKEGSVVGDVYLDADGNPVELIHRGNSATVYRLANLASVLTRGEMKDLHKRLGDIRSTDEKTGAWARYTGGTFNGLKGFEADFNMLQTGIDTRIGQSGPRVGVAFSYADVDADDDLGKTDTDAYSFAAYGVWTAENGFFTDLIARAANLSTDMKADTYKTDLDSWLYSLSGEVGMRWNWGTHFYAEPALEVTYTLIDGEEFNVGDVRREFDSGESLITRLSGTFGVLLPNDRGNLYARLAVANESLGDFEMTSSLPIVSRTVDASLDGTWYEYALGADLYFGQHSYLYVDLERTEGGDLDEDWRANIGVRYSF